MKDVRMSDKAHRVPKAACINCGHKMDSASGVNHDDQPKPGDISICIECGHIMAFNNDLKYRELTAEEAKAVAGMPEVVVTQAARAQVMKGMKR